METSVTPIRPDEVSDKHQSTIPSLVVQTINGLLVKNFRGGSVRLFQNDILDQLTKEGMNRKEIFDNGWLDIENLYRSYGWRVTYDKPGHNESYKANFIFSKK